MRLPVEDAIPDLRQALAAHGAAVLVAPPGAGKTTHVPLVLRDEAWCAGKRIVLLEPRRLAARAAAARMAALLAERVGETVGLRVRMDTRVSARTRLEVVTEGVLARMIAEDPALENVALVIFDEFHERSVHADVGLALTLHVRALLRPELRVLVMSATIDAAAVARLLGDAAVVHSAGRTHAVETHYMQPRDARTVEATVVRAVERALHEAGGDVLVFLPGAGEIRRVGDALAQRDLGAGTHVLPLHGAMSLDEQDRAIRPTREGERKVVLATTIAQTSLTIEGVRAVVDGGYTRVPRYSPRSGMTRLETVRVSRAAADQRRGRAGRTAPGVCYRLWSAAEDATLRPHDTPEILEADLAPVLLELLAAGVHDASELAWLDPPPAGAMAEARELLHELRAVDARGALTPHGRELARIGTHPRLAHMLLRARATHRGSTASMLAALLEERDFMGGAPAERDPDVRTRLAILAGDRAGAAVDAGGVRRVRDVAARWRERLGADTDKADAEAAGELLALAYPDRVAQRRSGALPRYVLRNGSGASLPPGSGLHNEPFLVAAELDGRQPEAFVLLAAPLTRSEIERDFADQIVTDEHVLWDAESGSVTARRTRRLGALILSDDPLREPDPQLIERAVLEALVAGGFRLLNWSREAHGVRERLAFLHRHDPAWPDVTDAGLAATVRQWLGPHLGGVRRRAELARIPVADALLSLMSWQQRARFEELAPAHYRTPGGYRARIDYGDPAVPVLAVRLQDMFGETRTPTVLGGRVPLTLHLLAPNQRPVQVTQDLASFWRTAYAEVRQQLRARYPRHRWPEDPLAAGSAERG